jgi:hypothetical protein
MVDFAKKNYFFFDIVTYIICLILMMIFRPDIGMTFAFIFLVVSILLAKRYSLLKFLSISFIMALIWQIVGGKEYFYGKDFWFVAGINVFPLLVWTIGLFVAYMVFFYMFEYFVSPKSSILKKNAVKLFMFIIFYWIVLITAETLAFHVFGFKNLAGAKYVGLPLCDCIHSPRWMQAVYLCMGPLYISLIYLLRSKKQYELFKKKILSKNK